jgi:hypothetical protein
MWIVQSLIFLFSAIGLHAVICRLPMHRAPLRNFLIVGALGGAALAVRLHAEFGSDVETAASLLMYAFTCELYIFLFSMVSSSISVSLLLTLRLGGVANDHLAVQYSSSGMISRRVDKLVAAGLLSQIDDRHILTDKGRRLIRTFSRLRVFFGLAGTSNEISYRE